MQLVCPISPHGVADRHKKPEIVSTEDNVKGFGTL
jgi:hypothetical protein